MQDTNVKDNILDFTTEINEKEVQLLVLEDMESVQDLSILDKLSSNEVCLTVGLSITFAVIHFKAKTLYNKKNVGYRGKAYRINESGERSHYAYLSSLDQV